MSFGAHLVELRRRLGIAAFALIVGMVIAFFITDPVIWLIAEPARQVEAQRGMEGRVSLMFDTVTGAFDLRLRMSFALSARPPQCGCGRSRRS